MDVARANDHTGPEDAEVSGQIKRQAQMGVQTRAIVGQSPNSGDDSPEIEYEVVPEKEERRRVAAN